MILPTRHLNHIVFIVLLLGIGVILLPAELEAKAWSMGAPQPGTGALEDSQQSNSLHVADAGPVIHDLTTNANQYPDGKIPRYQKLEISFQVDSVVNNPYLPYDAAPPSGLEPGIGITIDALFSPDGWQTTYTMPAFYYQDFLDEIKNNREWFYPAGEPFWKVRFSPHKTGTWQFKIVAQDATGIGESPVYEFQVTTSTNPGLLRVSQRDARYFEYDNGAYFPASGYNMNFDHVSWVNPVLANQAHFQAMSQNGIQLVRIWLSQWGIYSSAWNPWNSINPSQHGQYIPYTGLTFEKSYPGSDVSMRIGAVSNPCMFTGFMKAPPAVKRNTTYRVRIRYQTSEIDGPRIAGQPYGFVAKTGGWLWGDGDYCNDPGTGTVVTSHQNQDTPTWQILEGSLNTGNSDFLANFYLVMENANQGKAFADYVWIEEDLGGGQYGPNIVSKPWMAHHLYMEQRNSYALDKALELAESYGIYFKLAILEKNEGVMNHIDFQGEPIPDDPRCWDSDPNNDPDRCPGNQWFYGNWRQDGKIRWLQRAWWRYLQARWGYSANIHSWELLNEGDPWNGMHYTMADEFGRYMHQFIPNDHLVTTSFWHSFPKDNFWANPDYSHVDYADYHRYIQQGDPGFSDAALATYETSMQLGAYRPGGAGKPVMRGETGFTDGGSEPGTSQLLADSGGIWLHNFIWGGTNPGGLIESYWYENYHIYNQQRDGTYNFDHRYHYKPYVHFLGDIPLSNGYYQDALASASDETLRAWGQKDLVNGRAHLWIQNVNHTWKNVVDGTPIQPVSGTVSIAGFEPGLAYRVQWWDTYTQNASQQVIQEQPIQTQPDGTLVIPISDVESDLAIKVFPLRSEDRYYINLPAVLVSR